jgi:hypothetical protein
MEAAPESALESVSARGDTWVLRRCVSAGVVLVVSGLPTWMPQDWDGRSTTAFVVA